MLARKYDTRRPARFAAITSVGAVLLGNAAVIAATWHLDVTRLPRSSPVGIASLVTWIVVIRLGLAARRAMSCATIVG